MIVWEDGRTSAASGVYGIGYGDVPYRVRSKRMLVVRSRRNKILDPFMYHELDAVVALSWVG